MERILSRLPALETLLWILASIVAFVAFLVFAPSFLTSPAPNTPVALRLTPTPPATASRPPTATSVPLPPAPVARTPVPVPAPRGSAQAFKFISDPTQSGYLLSGETKPHWGDRNLHAGVFKGKTYHTLLYFELTGLAPGSRIQFADVELTGLNRDNLGPGGQWSLQLLQPEIIPNWKDRANDDLAQASTLTAVGESLGPEDLAAGQMTQFVFGPDQVSVLQDAINRSTVLVFRLDGVAASTDSLFTWDGGGLDLTKGDHPTLHIVAEPGQFVIVTNTPEPQNVITAAAQKQTVDAFVTRFGTPTPFPRNFATATPIIIVTPPPTPENVETRVAEAMIATAVAQTTGTYTPTPLNWITATPAAPTVTRTPTITLTPTITPTFTPSSTPTQTGTSVALSTVIATYTPPVTATEPSAQEKVQTPNPEFLKGNILFISNRLGGTRPLVMKPDGILAEQQLTGRRFYDQAAVREPFSPDRSRRVTYVTDPNGRQQLAIEEMNTGVRTQITFFTKGIAYDAVWSPDGGRLAFVSTETRGDEIYVMEIGSKTPRRITDSSGLGLPFNKRPSWSPDSSQIVFWSSRSGHPQIWLMNADGSNLHNLSNNEFDEIDPIWVK